MKFYLTRFGAIRKELGVHLVHDNWDDFGFRVLYNAFYVTDEEEIKLGLVKIGSIGMLGGKPDLEDSFEILSEEFFSVGTSSKYYKNIKGLGKKVREEIFIGLRDIAFSEEAYKVADNEYMAKKSLFREVYPAQVKNQLRRIAHGGVELTEYNFSYAIKQSKSNKNILYFDVEPNSLPPTNVHAIIGSNGSGKTTSVKGILNEYLNHSDELETDFSNAIFVSFSLFDRSYELFKKKNTKKISFSYIGSCNKDGSIKSHNEIISEFVSCVNKLIGTKKLDILSEALEVLEGDMNLADYGIKDLVDKVISNPEEYEVGVFKNTIASIFSKCSSGHQIILLTTVRLIELIVEKTLIVFDEPETHLHPPLLSAFIRCISDLISNANAVAIMATHSPVVLQEIPSSCVSILCKSGDYTSVIKPKIETFGENIGVLTEVVFGLEIMNTGFHTLLKKIVKGTDEYIEVINKFNNELSIDAKSILRAYIDQKE